jgi:hypothetical protein
MSAIVRVVSEREREMKVRKVRKEDEQDEEGALGPSLSILHQHP